MHFIDTDRLNFIDRKLRQILDRIETSFGPQTITSLYRMNDDGVHGTLPLRGVDLRCRNKKFGEVLVNWVNSMWTYDPSRPEVKVAVAHGEGWNYHIHLQVHPATVELF